MLVEVHQGAAAVPAEGPPLGPISPAGVSSILPGLLGHFLLLFHHSFRLDLDKDMQMICLLLFKMKPTTISLIDNFSFLHASGPYYPNMARWELKEILEELLEGFWGYMMGNMIAAFFFL